VEHDIRIYVLSAMMAAGYMSKGIEVVPKKQTAYEINSYFIILLWIIIVPINYFRRIEI